jgi:hypothetical protein
MKVVSGDPDPKHVSTRYTERQNLTTRMAVTAPEGKWNIQRGSFINPPLVVGVRNFHWHPASLVESERWPEPGQWSNQQLRSKD